MTGSIPQSDMHAVSDLKARYFYCLDNKLWTSLRELFSDDARFEGFAFGADGPENFVATVSAFLSDVHSTHQGTTPQFVREGSAIRAIWRMHDYLTWEPNSRVYMGFPIPGMYGIHGYGYYEDEYSLTDKGWRISFSRLVRTRIDPLVGNHVTAPDYKVLKPDLDWLGRP